MRKLIAATLMVTAILTAGCSEEEPTSGQQDGARRTAAAQDQAQAGCEKPKTVVVNEGMSEREEDELNQRLAELEEQVDDQPTSQPTQEPESSGESEALAAAQSYYAAAAAGDYVQTYNELSAFSQSPVHRGRMGRREHRPAERLGQLHHQFRRYGGRFDGRGLSDRHLLGRLQLRAGHAVRPGERPLEARAYPGRVRSLRRSHR